MDEHEAEPVNTVRTGSPADVAWIVLGCIIAGVLKSKGRSLDTAEVS